VVCHRSATGNAFGLAFSVSPVGGWATGVIADRGRDHLAFRLPLARIGAGGDNAIRAGARQPPSGDGGALENLPGVCWARGSTAAFLDQKVRIIDSDE